jgi:hypothetical protein
MPARHRPGSTLSAAFWLLTVAWLCANLPPCAVSSGLARLAEQTRFSHQQRLTRDVAELLGTPRPAPTVARVPAPAQPRSKPATPPAPAPAFKKLEVPLGSTSRVAHPAAVAFRFPPAAAPDTGRGRAAPPHAPPRDRRVA